MSHDWLTESSAEPRANTSKFQAFPPANTVHSKSPQSSRLEGGLDPRAEPPGPNPPTQSPTP